MPSLLTLKIKHSMLHVLERGRREKKVGEEREEGS